MTPAQLSNKDLHMPGTDIPRSSHGHHKIAAAIFVGSLILGAAMILSAELVKPERFEFHPGSDPSNYVIYDRDSGRAISVQFNTKNPTASLTD
jgi:hypothetical protein